MVSRSAEFSGGSGAGTGRCPERWEQVPGQAGSWCNVESARGFGELLPHPQPRTVGSPPLVLPLSRDKCSVAPRFFSSVPLADVLLRDNGIVRKHLP